ncbi:GNAT family N-acetyltransferase [Kitasatospora sp. NPDC127111]|uniref:GNAT family N-acetyltransferase n=1 Tax=Kitasatospora sp. NPDC127111 TaxID=3345363 RepID=UPI00363DFFFF
MRFNRPASRIPGRGAAHPGGGARHVGHTGVLRPWRGRGLARALKTHAAHRLVADGARTAHTEAEAANAAMVAVSSALGHRWGRGHHRLVTGL